MAESLLLSGLVKKYRDLTAEQSHHQKLADELNVQARIIHQAIKIADPDYDLNQIKPKRYYRQPVTLKGREAQRMLLDVPRDAEKPLTLGQIMVAIDRRCQPKIAGKERGKHRDRLRKCLERCCAIGKVESTETGYRVSAGD